MTTPLTPSVTQEAAFTAIRDFLLAVLPGGTEVVQGQDNRVPMPSADNFVVMTASRRGQLSQTRHEYAPAEDTQTIERSTELDFQLDVYGADAADNATVITTLLRDAFGVDNLKGTGLAPLFCSDPRQMPLIAGEQQYIQRWIVEAAFHANLAVTVTQQFADSLVTTLQEVD